MTSNTDRISFFVPGFPRPGGSKKGFYNKKAGRVIITEDCKSSKEWRATVALFAHEYWGVDPLKGPLKLEIIFDMPRPKNHFVGGQKTRGLKLTAPSVCITRPDASKLTRSTEDALTGILWDDDAQIVEQHIKKQYGCRPGAQITVEALSK